MCPGQAGLKRGHLVFAVDLGTVEQPHLIALKRPGKVLFELPPTLGFGMEVG